MSIVRLQEVEFVWGKTQPCTFSGLHVNKSYNSIACPGMPHPLITERGTVSGSTEPAFHIADVDGKSKVLD